MRHEDETFDTTKYVLKQYSAVRSGRMIAWAQYWHTPGMFHPLKFMMNIVGITPPVADFSSTKFQQYIQRTVSSGVTITTLAEEASRDPESYRKFYELWMEIARDQPLPDTFTPVSYENFMKEMINGPNILPNACLIARVNDRYVGLSSSGKTENEPSNLYQWLTGTLREYRGRGIAMTLKLGVIEFAKRNGYEIIKTWNDSTNVGMLAINQKLGYRRHVGWITYEKRLDPETVPK